MRILSGAALGASATLGLTVLVSSLFLPIPHWSLVAIATSCGAVAGVLWQRNEARKDEDRDSTIQRLTSQLRRSQCTKR